MVLGSYTGQLSFQGRGDLLLAEELDEPFGSLLRQRSHPLGIDTEVAADRLEGRLPVLQEQGPVDKRVGDPGTARLAGVASSPFLPSTISISCEVVIRG